MSRRVIDRDPDEERAKEYSKKEKSGEAMEAIWEALDALDAAGIDIGQKAKKYLQDRSDIKSKYPKK